MNPFWRRSDCHIGRRNEIFRLYSDVWPKLLPELNRRQHHCCQTSQRHSQATTALRTQDVGRREKHLLPRTGVFSSGLCHVGVSTMRVDSEQNRRTASRTIQSTSDGILIPAAAAARGARLCSVNPGIAFNSRTHTLPQWSSIRSTRDSPSASIAWAALMAVSQILWESWQGKLESSRYRVELLTYFA